MRSFTRLNTVRTESGETAKYRQVEVPGELTPAEHPIDEELVLASEKAGENHIKVKLEGTGEDPLSQAVVPSRMAHEQRMGRLRGPRGRPFEKGNKAGRKPKLAMLGIDIAYLNIQDPRYRAALRRAEFYLKRRSRELAVMFGYASAGVNGVLSSASLQLAASKYLSQLAAELAGVDMKLFVEYMRMAMQLQNSARQNEMAAYEICAKEASIAKKLLDQEVPWLKSGGDIDAGQ